MRSKSWIDNIHPLQSELLLAFIQVVAAGYRPLCWSDIRNSMFGLRTAIDFTPEVCQFQLNERYHTPRQALDPEPQAAPFRQKLRRSFRDGVCFLAIRVLQRKLLKQPLVVRSHSEMEPTCWFRFSRSFENQNNGIIAQCFLTNSLFVYRKC